MQLLQPQCSVLCKSVVSLLIIKTKKKSNLISLNFILIFNALSKQKRIEKTKEKQNENSFQEFHFNTY